ncbi:MAG: class I SAM-dependent methyltransferase [Candidatus Limivivens sp.]|nr:class I SAM-dependent methyltransferase [Candidatus Limivivens sp.]
MEFQEYIAPEAGEIKTRIVRYWTKRSHAFGELREQEQESEVGRAWLAEIEGNLPSGRRLKILDVGCGTGMFSLMLAAKGHEVIGIDLTEHMVLHARELAEKQHSTARFFCMDAENPDFPDNTFDAVITRNLTWTLPHAEQAYAQWLRILKNGGVLLNFDADYGHDSFRKEDVQLPPEHAHRTMPEEMLQECEDIKKCLDISSRTRPLWDIRLLERIGYRHITADTGISSRIYREVSPFFNPTPMFLLRAEKEER